MHCTPSWLQGAWLDIVSVTMPLLSIKDLAVAISTRVGPAEDDHCYTNKGRNRSRLFVRERVELLIEPSGR